MRPTDLVCLRPHLRRLFHFHTDLFPFRSVSTNGADSFSNPLARATALHLGGRARLGANRPTQGLAVHRVRDKARMHEV